jgi:hypothetical protein
MAGAINSVYAVVAIATAILGLLFVVLGPGERDRGLLVGGALSIAVLVGLGATLLM